MCLIALHPAGAPAIPASVIDSAMLRHPDGFGIALRGNVEGAPALRTVTFAPNERDAFRKVLAEVQAAGVEFAVHFRMATSGPKTAEFSHPYTYEDPDPAVGTVSVLHNGVIRIAHDHAKESDTAAFVRLVLARLPSRWWDNPALTYLVGEAIGWSRLVLMTATETVNLQERSGTWDDGIWYSSEHKPLPVRAPSTWQSPKVTGTPPTPGSKRQQKRAARAAANAAKRTAKVTAKGQKGLTVVEKPLIVVHGTADPIGDRMYSHGGHNTVTLVDVDPDKDEDYLEAIRCVTCHTTGDLFVIEGVAFVDLAHMAPVEQADTRELVTA